ncbi:MAG: glutaredoxin domain-containing protein [Cetobacterium sp.]|uniref:glutaredoxin family protein n=1 Tax=unclassified Cetobacterium TaxID=2630983 RepID=UPI00163CB29E|nr:glutaredoxin domain-containing protein [Cetobacterium sp. 2A]MBC2855729.1 glutaredoxin family protein [Cetobacterium sp. 2A]
MKIMLFTTPTCQYCGPAKELLTDVDGVEYIDATQNLDLAQMYGIRSVPALVVEKCSGAQVFTGLDQISQFVDNQANPSGGCGCSCGH